jgi:hypothetical protein
MKNNKLQIVSVRIEQKPDESPDFSFLGSYSNEPKNQFSIERENAGSREYKWFNPCDENYAGLDTATIKTYCAQYYARMESYNRGEWQMIGVIAKAEIRNPQTDCVQTIRSGGLWGVESDAGDYLKEIAREQLSELKTELMALNKGIGERAIAYAIKNCKL